MKTADQCLERLTELISKAGNNYYERISLIYTLMQNKEWIRTDHDNDDYKAAEFLQEEYLHDLSGSMSIFDLMHIYQKFPNEADWKKYKYKLKVLHGFCKPEPETRSSFSRIKREDFEALQEQKTSLEYQVKKIQKDVRTKEEEITNLKNEVAKLKEENARLKGRIEQLERTLKGKLATV